MSVKDQVYFDDIKEALCGIGRVIKFVTEKKTKESWIMSITEGQFVRGKQHGYSRRIMSKDGSAIVGFYHDGEPFGKWAWFQNTGYLY